MPIIYVDFTSNSGNITGTWTFTNGNATVNGVGGAALVELVAGNYVKISDGVQWYKVSSVVNDNQFILTLAFQQTTKTDGANATLKNAKDGSSILNAFCHINQATTDTGRSAGDIIKIRANQLHTYRNCPLIIDDSGTLNSRITLKGCNISDDPWSDGSDVKPILDFVNTGAYLGFSTKHYWIIQNLDFYRSGYSSGAIYISISVGIIIDNCICRNGNTGIRNESGSNNLFQNCIFHTNNAANIKINNSLGMRIKDCVLFGVGGYGLDSYASDVEIYDTTFGIPTVHNVADIFYNARASLIRCRNVILGTPNQIAGITDTTTKGSYIQIEDDAQTKFAQKSWYWNGRIERGTSDVGGCVHWLRAIPNSNCDGNTLLSLFVDLPIWLLASPKTITVKLCGNSWTVLPTNSQLYIELYYWNSASAKRTSVKSIQTLPANDTWTDFSVTVTPFTEGPAYLSCYLGGYEDSSESVYVNITQLPILT